MTSAEHAFVEAIRVARVRKRMYQRTLATEMTNRGHAWRQATVSQVEAGTRRLSLAEATDVAELLDITVVPARSQVMA